MSRTMSVTRHVPIETSAMPWLLDELDRRGVRGARLGGDGAIVVSVVARSSIDAGNVVDELLDRVIATTTRKVGSGVPLGTQPEQEGPHGARP